MDIVRLTGRNLRLFFRDRAGVFFSLLSALILIALYALFLGGLQVENLEGAFPNADLEDISWFVNTWVFAGITMITTLTTALAALNVFVDDRATDRFRDFVVSPIRRSSLILGYLSAAFIVSLSMTSLIIVIGQGYLLTQGQTPMAPLELLTLLGYTVLSAAAFSALAAFAVTFIRSTGAFSALSTVVGTLIGFLAGAYIPVGALPEGVVHGMNALPFAQSAMLIRQPYTAGAVDALTGGQQQAVDELHAFYGISAYVGDTEIINPLAIGVLVMLLLAFAALGAWRLSGKIR
ncbi:ABC transporter permease [Nesterenkonia sp. NBAIMH1]|uniref:ABC transporter permease n=1 Tax=Nesterenkonia sp. NBAIMH1 TaxID=2600320 RepID=UPI001FF04183|nr:ABC transporter permease [Nesterenkonia sp. NBAIMH1]